MNKTQFQNIVQGMIAEQYPNRKPITEEHELFPKDKISEVYHRFKGDIKEGVNEIDFSTRIRGVFYEYADGVADVTPTTTDPTRDAEVEDLSNPEVAKKKGEELKQKADTLDKFGKAMKSIDDQRRAATLEEYVHSEILPMVVEIMKKNENPRATKKELMEMFKM